MYEITLSPGFYQAMNRLEILNARYQLNTFKSPIEEEEFLNLRELVKKQCFVIVEYLARTGQLVVEVEDTKFLKKKWRSVTFPVRGVEDGGPMVLRSGGSVVHKVRALSEQGHPTFDSIVPFDTYCQEAYRLHRGEANKKPFEQWFEDHKVDLTQKYEEYKFLLNKIS